MTDDLVELIQNIEFGNVPEDVVEKTKLCILDYLADCIAGTSSDLPSVRIIRDYARTRGGRPESTIFGTDIKAPAAEAAMVNSISGEVLELGDGDNKTIGHPGQSIIPAILAIAEDKGASGREIIQAVLAGYETMLYVGDSIIPMAYDRGFSASACLGNFGACAGAGKILRLGRDKTRNAIALAASASGYLRSWNLTGTMDKDLMVGEATRRGVLAAILADAGYTGTSNILEGDLGFCMAMAGNFRTVHRDPGEYRIRDVYFKPYPSCRVTHSTIDSVMRLCHEHQIRAENIKRVIVYTDSHGAQVAIPAPKTFVAIRFSQQYAATVAFLEGKVTVDQYTEEYAARPEVAELIAKVEVRVDPEMEGNWPTRYSSRVEVLTNDGKEYAVSTEYPKGDPHNPMTREDIVDKARGLMESLYAPSRTEAIIETVFEIEKLADTKRLIKLLQD